jgi:sodium/proline symporter
VTRSTVALLAAFCAIGAMFVIAAWAARRTHNAADFLIGNRRLGAWLTAFGYGGNTMSAWLFVALIAIAFRIGRPAVWMAGGIYLGTLLTLFFVAPRLRAIGSGNVTITQVICSDAGDRLQSLIACSIGLIVLFALTLQIAVVTHFGATYLGADLGFDVGRTTVIPLAIIVIALFAGGMRAAAGLDALQCVAMLFVVIVGTVAGLVLLGGFPALGAGLDVFEPAVANWNGAKNGVVAIAFCGGLFGFGAACLGQPAALARVLAARDERALRSAKFIALVWVAIALAAALACGWTARVLYAGLEYSEHSVFALSGRLLPPWISAILVVTGVFALLCAMASPLFTLATQCSVDLKRTTLPLSEGWTRFALLLVSVLVIALTLWIPSVGLDQALFSMTAVGAALGPVLLVRLSGKRIRPACTLGAIWSGFALTTLFHLLPDAPGDFMERVLPFIAALGIALSGGERRRNPDRADRSQETVHDRVPI